jgi:hypothetical protein
VQQTTNVREAAAPPWQWRRQQSASPAAGTAWQPRRAPSLLQPPACDAMPSVQAHQKQGSAAGGRGPGRAGRAVRGGRSGSCGEALRRRARGPSRQDSACRSTGRRSTPRRRAAGARRGCNGPRCRRGARGRKLPSCSRKPVRVVRRTAHAGVKPRAERRQQGAAAPGVRHALRQAASEARTCARGAASRARTVTERRA